MYQDAATLERQRALGADYVLIGPQEREAYAVSDARFRAQPLVVESGPYRLVATDPAP